MEDQAPTLKGVMERPEVGGWKGRGVRCVSLETRELMKGTGGHRRWRLSLGSERAHA